MKSNSAHVLFSYVYLSVLAKLKITPTSFIHNFIRASVGVHVHRTNGGSEHHTPNSAFRRRRYHVLGSDHRRLHHLFLQISFNFTLSYVFCKNKLITPIILLIIAMHYFCVLTDIITIKVNYIINNFLKIKFLFWGQFGKWTHH